MKQLNIKTKFGAPASYHSLLRKYPCENFDFIIEGGSRDAVDAIKLNRSLGKKVYAFECNPSCLQICKDNLEVNDVTSEQVSLQPYALYNENTVIDFYCTIDTPNPPCGPGDSNLIEVDGKRANIGTSSILPFTDTWKKIHTSEKISVNAITLDKFIENNNLISNKYILCMDLQGAEYYAILGNETYIKNCNMIILECGTHQYEAPNECKLNSLVSLLTKHGFHRLNKNDKGDSIFSR